jgi:2-polyprenyl-6-methoxyphenol hydroxylase-like FAD-dependent oxidoreductase
VVVQARTLELYQQLGIADEAVALGVTLETFHLREGGEEVARFSLKDLGEGLSPFPFALCFPQDDHERFLIGKLEAAGVSVEWGVELESFTQDEGQVRAILVKDGARTVCEAAYLCGCDGAHSRVRQGLGLDFAGGTYEQLFYVADAKTAGGFQRDLYGNLAANGLALMFPVRSSGMQRLIGIVPGELRDSPDLSFEDIRPSAERVLGVRVEKVNWFSTYRVHHRVASRFRVGRAFVAGDASHIHSPAGGQGMNTGIGDAVNLAWKLADAIRGRAAPSILDTYEGERIAFARKLVDTTDRVFRGMVDPGLAGRFLRTWLVPHLLPFLGGFSAARRAFFGTISQVRISYRGSALSEGRAGDVSGGDRLPWVETPEGSNFAPLAGLDWRLHVYGTASPALKDAAAALGLPLDAFAWSDGAARAGLERDAAYLLRPDGHVALASLDGDPRALDAFAAKHGLAFGRAS